MRKATIEDIQNHPRYQELCRKRGDGGEPMEKIIIKAAWIAGLIAIFLYFFVKLVGGH